MTPLEKLITLPEAASFLRESITLDALLQQACSMMDIEAARQAREELTDVAPEVGRFRDIWSYASDAAA